MRNSRSGLAVAILKGVDIAVGSGYVEIVWLLVMFGGKQSYGQTSLADTSHCRIGILIEANTSMQV
jgi:hypothetical protein